jgi:hypothetical protein
MRKFPWVWLGILAIAAVFGFVMVIGILTLFR